MMASIVAARRGAEVHVYEKNEKTGKKLYITGKGRCNLTNACDMEELLESVKSNKKFLYSAFYGFTNENAMDFFEKEGLKLQVERGNRVFPLSDRSADEMCIRDRPRGVLPAIITPMTNEGSVNIPALRKLIDYMIDGGVHGIFAMGTTAEFYAVTPKEYQEVLEATVDQVAGRVPVYAGANAIGTRQSIDLVHIAEKVGGIDAISVLTPYFISLTQDEVYNHFASIANSTDMNIIPVSYTHLDVYKRT